MNSMSPIRLLVTRRLPEAVLARAARDYEAVLNPEDRLYDAALPDRRGQLLEFGIIESFARVARVGAQKLDWRLARAPRQRARFWFFARGAQKRGKSSAEAGPMFGSGGVFRH